MFGPQLGHVWATQNSSVLQTYPGRLLDSSKQTQTCLATRLDMFGHLPSHHD
jgi:hypothetical protein